MAKSNWATLAWNEKGELSDRLTVGDTWVEPYKNWIYVHDPQAWREDDSFSEDVVMEVQHGSFRYRSIRFSAKRMSLQNAMLFLVERGWYHELEDDPSAYNCLFGICCYGYDDDSWIGVTPELIEELRKWTEELDPTHPDPDELPEHPTDEERQKVFEEYYKKVNAMPYSIWNDVSAPKEFLHDLIKSNYHSAYNQGSVYMYRALAGDKEQITSSDKDLLREVSQEKESFLSRILETPSGKEALEEAYKPVIDALVKELNSNKEE